MKLFSQLPVFAIGEKHGECFLKHGTSLGHCEAILKVSNIGDFNAQLNTANRDIPKAQTTGFTKQLSLIDYFCGRH